MSRNSFIPLILSVLISLNVAPAIAQDPNVQIHSLSGDSVDCSVHFSVYREFLRMELYNEAITSWRIAFSNCPETSERLYIDGVTMYRAFIEEAPDGPDKEGLIDTLMLIYDRRMEYFRGEGNVLGRKGADLLTYRGTDIEQVHNAYEMLRRSLELEGRNSRDAVMVLCISSGIRLSKEGAIAVNQVIEDYFMIDGILLQLEGRSSRWERARTTIEEMLIGENIFTCETLNGYFDPLYAQNRKEKAFLNNLISVYTVAGCERSELYLQALEHLYEIEPGPEPAHNLARLFITRSDFKKAAGYLKEAVAGENIENDTRTEWYYELAVVSYATEDFCDAIDYAREAIDLKPDYGEAYILLGDAFIASRRNLGEEFEQRTAFWAAADMYEKAASVDPEVSEEARQKLADFSGQFPGQEEIFFRDLNAGDPYLVTGCINENTTVRPGE